MRALVLVGTSLLALYASAPTASALPMIADTPGFLTFTAIDAGLYGITAFGAQGGSSGKALGPAGGLGAEVQGDFALTQGEVLSIYIGGMGGAGDEYDGGGGGGGSFVVGPGNTLLVVAGGGGGGGGLFGGSSGVGLAGTAGGAGMSGGAGGSGGGGGDRSGGGGGGFLGNGGGGGTGDGGGGFPSLAGAEFGGGFGGGGGAGGSGGGGGGYSGGGGGGGDFGGSGGGGGSFLAAGATYRTLVAGVHAGDGAVYIGPVVTPPVDTPVPEPAGAALFGSGLAGLLAVRRRHAR